MQDESIANIYLGENFIVTKTIDNYFFKYINNNKDHKQRLLLRRKLDPEDTLDEDSEGTVTRPVYVERTFPIERKGMYYLMFSSCNELTGDVLISGQTEWTSLSGRENRLQRSASCPRLPAPGQ